jgi:hypothetical protein
MTRFFFCHYRLSLAVLLITGGAGLSAIGACAAGSDHPDAAVLPDATGPADAGQPDTHVEFSDAAPDAPQCTVTAPVVDDGGYVDTCPYCDSWPVCNDAWGWWRFDELGGSTAYDSTGNGHDGVYSPDINSILTGAVMSSCRAIEYGPDGGNVNFGSADVAVIDGGIPGAFDSNDFSVEFWIRETSTAYLVALSRRKGCDCYTFWEIDIGDGQSGTPKGAISLEMAQGGGNSTSCVADMGCFGTVPVNDGKWHFVTVVRSVTPSSKQTIYIDGKLDTSCAAPTAVFDPTQNPPMLAGTGPCVGVDQRKTVANVDMDELAVYARALTASEVATHYTQALACGQTIRPN